MKPLNKVDNMNKIDIILMTCNRLDFTKKCIEELTTRIIPFSKVNLIVTDDKSSDGTFEFLEEMVEKKIVSVLLNNNGKGYSGISVAWDDGLKYVSSEYFITTFDDIIEELKIIDRSERENRLIDLNSDSSMEDKKREGYF